MSQFAISDQEAGERFERFKSIDPFPEIFPALLNSADILDYVAATGMIYPFDPNKVGPASYDMVIDGEYLYWDADGKKRQGLFNPCTPIPILKNSITYVTVRQRFRLPDYIALRFNFKIVHVHRGLLLGTGPLIDPGFQGKLMIPIHNLTSNEYSICQGERLISVEFTKISTNSRWNSVNPIESQLTDPSHFGQYAPNTMRLKDKKFEDYLKVELPVGTISVESSLSGTLAQANKSIKQFKLWQKFSYGASVSVFVAVVAVILSTWSLISDANKNVADASAAIKAQPSVVEHSPSPLSKDFDLLKRKVEDLEQLVKNYESKLNSSKQDLQSGSVENSNK
ncbi:dCTP deaminase domain-containing protein [Desulfovibrio sp. QI0434]